MYFYLIEDKESSTKCNMLFSTIYHKDKEKGKYPEAYVFSPIKGIENKYPVTGLDFASLYPSLIIAYNLSPEKLILSREEANNIREKEMNFMKLNSHLTVVFLMPGLELPAVFILDFVQCCNVCHNVVSL